MEILIQQNPNQLVVLQGEEEQIDMGKINSLQQEINELMVIDELKWSQRAKENWLKQGDKNSKHFHACVKQRRRTNQITEVRDVEGIVCSTPKAVEKAFLSYFQTLFTSDSLRGISDCLHGLPSDVTREINNQ